MKLHINKLLLIPAGLTFFSSSLFSQFTLKIEITDIRNNTGKIMLEVLDEKEKVINQQMADIKDNRGAFIIGNLPAGRFAVRFYHDENLNQKMETNMFGKPTEGYGFSNNVSEKFGMPPFEKWLFDLNEDKTISLKAVY
jgi:uncharacterized protein (DUF2141 family)